MSAVLYRVRTTGGCYAWSDPYYCLVRYKVAGGSRIEEIRIPDKPRDESTTIMIKGAIAKTVEIYAAGELLGVLSVGGVTNAVMGTTIMKALPFGIPKLMVCSAAMPSYLGGFFGSSDIALLSSVVDMAGLHELSKNVLKRAAGAICGMVEGSAKAPVSLLSVGEKKLVAMTHFGPCEECAVIVRKQLEQRGYQVIGFSAAGVGDRAMEDILERQNIFAAVIDIAPGGVGEELLGFTRAAGPHGLE